MKFRHEESPKVLVDLIPMIDVVFQLILFFLVSTTFAMLPGISISLPSSKTAESTETIGITITASSDGTLWMNEKEVSMDDLSFILSKKSINGVELSKEERLSYPIRLEADELVTNGTIVKLFDVLRFNGFSAVNLRTRDE